MLSSHAEDEEEWLPLGETMDFWDQGYVANNADEGEDDDGHEDYEELESYALELKEAEALNALEHIDPESPESGEAIQLQLAANAAVKGKDFKGKGKVVRSQLSLDERRAKMKTLKATPKCPRCGGIGHWAGDPECKFSCKKSQACPKEKVVKASAHLAVYSSSSSEHHHRCRATRGVKLPCLPCQS